jgi:PTH1 family peptidyl-tRNA hydrolase
MWLIVGLGNPEARYLLTRHNIGFMAVDAMLGDAPPWKTEHQALTLKAKLDGQDVLFVKPQTYMNLSGQAVRALLDYYKIDLDHLLVIHDDIDQGLGAIRVQRNRGAGGHNGIKSITEHLNTQDYARLKLGVGRPSHPGQDVASYVLQNFSKDEMGQLPDFLHRAGDAVEAVCTRGWSQAANEFNRGAEKESE